MLLFPNLRRYTIQYNQVIQNRDAICNAEVLAFAMDLVNFEYQFSITWTNGFRLNVVESGYSMSISTNSNEALARSNCMDRQCLSTSLFT